MDISQPTAPARSAIVTGAAQGLGLAIARRFVATGSKVLLVDRDPKVVSLAEQTCLDPTNCFYLVQDLQLPTAATDIFAHALNTLGSVDTIINNAAWTLYKPFLETTIEEFDRAVAVNQRAPYLLAQELFRYVSRSPAAVKDAVVINIASVNALAGNTNLVAYAGTKGALAAMTRAMAVEMAPLGVRVVTVSPGVLDTPIARTFVKDGVFEGRDRFDKFLVKRFTTPDEIAELVMFLCSPAGGTVTGANWIMDGGYLAQ